MTSVREVATVRAMLFGDVAECERLKAEIRHASSENVVAMVLQSAFEVMVHRRFGPDVRVGDIIQYVAAARTRHPLESEEFDILGAERLMRAALGDTEAAQGLTAQDATLMTPLLIDLLPFPPDERVVDEVLAEARERAEQAMRNLAG